MELRFAFKIENYAYCFSWHSGETNRSSWSWSTWWSGESIESIL